MKINVLLKKNIARIFKQQTSHNILYWLSIFRRLIIRSKKYRSMMDVFNKRKFFVIKNKEILFSLRDLGNSSISRGKFFFIKETDTISWIDSFEPNSNFLDVGANIGIFSLYAARKNHNIISVEPESLNFAALNININDNNFNKNITAFPFSVDSEKKIGNLELSELNWGKSGHNFSKKKNGIALYNQGSYSISLDDLSNESNFYPDYVKIDVDGNEFKVVQGMKNLLKNQTIKNILIEIDNEKDQNREIISFLNNYGYQEISKKIVEQSSPNIINYIFAHK